VVDIEIIGIAREYAVATLKSGYYGYVLSEDIYWTDNPDPLGRLAKGGLHRAQILDIEPQNQIGWIRFGLKQLFSDTDPWNSREVQSKFRARNHIEGAVVTRFIDFEDHVGAAVEITKGP
jgi:ribosomal protein S1